MMYAPAGGVPGSALVICRTPIYGANSAVGTGTCAAASRGAVTATARTAVHRSNEDNERPDTFMENPPRPTNDAVGRSSRSPAGSERSQTEIGLTDALAGEHLIARAA